MTYPSLGRQPPTQPCAQLTHSFTLLVYSKHGGTMPTSTEAKTLRKQLALDGADPFQLLATVLERNAQLTEQVRILTAIANRKGA
jgi:hypothetical protein